MDLRRIYYSGGPARTAPPSLARAREPNLALLPGDTRLDAENREKIEQLFVQYGRGVGSYVLARVGDVDLAEDITARVFLTVVRKIEQCRGSTVAWLWAIVRNEIGLHFRRRRSSLPLGDGPVDPAESPLEIAQKQEMQCRLTDALRRLTHQQQQIVTMKFFLKVPNTEIAEALGLSAGNVGVKVHRAIKRLQELMEGTQEREGSTS